MAEFINDPLAYLSDPVVLSDEQPIETIQVVSAEPIDVPAPTVIPASPEAKEEPSKAESQVELHPKAEEPKEEKKIKGPNSHLTDESFQQLIDWVESATKADDVPNEARLYLLEWLPALKKELDARKEPMSEGALRDVAIAGTAAVAGGLVGHNYGNDIANTAKDTVSITSNLMDSGHKDEVSKKVFDACVFLSKINRRWPSNEAAPGNAEDFYTADIDFRNLVNDMNSRVASKSIQNSDDAILTAVRIRMGYDPRTKALIYKLWSRLNQESN